MSSRLFRFLGLSAAVAVWLSGCNASDTASPVANSLEATPSLQSAAGVVGGNSQTVSITFVSSNNEPIADLSVSGLSSLPAGWSGPATFSCSSVSTGSGCVLNLVYAPSTTGNGALALNYSYTNAVGATLTGTLSIPFNSTSHDNVVATASPGGQITAVVPGGSQAVTVTFTTDDGQSASGLTLSTPLGSLPTGWSSGANAFSCATASTGNTCQLALTYAPQATGNGTLTLDYSYTDNAGEAKTGTAIIAYPATTDDSVAGRASPSGQITATAGSAQTSVNVTFATDDGNPATSLSITAGLNSLPSGWSAPGSFSCSTVSAGTACQLSLTYAPQYTDSGTLTLSYGYNNDAGIAKTGTVSVPYLATGPHLYVTTMSSTNGVQLCTMGAAGDLSSCTMTPSSGGPTEPVGIAFYGNTAYVADWGHSAIDVCAVNADGSLSGCTPYSTNFPSNYAPWALTIATAGNGNTYLYATDPNVLYGTVEQCLLNSDGSIASCSSAGGGIVYATGLAIGGGYAYIATYSGNINSGTYVFDVCTYGNDGTFSNCTQTGSGFNGASFVNMNNGYVYVVNENANTVSVCTVGANGALTSCPTSSLPGSIYDANSVVFNGSQAYVDGNQGLVLCAVDSATGMLENCSASDGGMSNAGGQQLAIH